MVWRIKLQMLPQGETMWPTSQRIAQQALGSHETMGSAGADRPLGHGPQQPGGPHGERGHPAFSQPHRMLRLTSPCQHFSLFFLSQRFYFFLGKESSVRMACLGWHYTVKYEEFLLQVVCFLHTNCNADCQDLERQKNLHWFPIFANASSFPSNLHRKCNAKDWAEFKYCIKQISVLLDNTGKVSPTFLPKEMGDNRTK